MSEKNRLPELLCPAGTPDALDAAIEGGADAVYLGGADMNARMHAGNFSAEQLRAAVRRAHAFGIKIYLTLNTLVTDRELPAFLSAAREASRAGVDALIVADIGGASLLRRAIPGMELHASTQMSGHNSLMGAELQRLGFSRMVAARELSAPDLCRLVSASPIETEVFVHGALCVSHSGQCLFSSVVGGRSGNRGDCAQPCRLPYRCAGSGGGNREERARYPLSLKDLSLAAHVPELIAMGVASLKIEGRMKSPEYVRDTARIWRRLLDERRGATPQELQELAACFARSGLTDGYYTGRMSADMLGVRRESDKRASRAAEPFAGLQRRVPLKLHAELREGEPARLTLSDGRHTVTVTGDCPEKALTAPMGAQQVLRSLSRFGGTVYRVSDAQAEVGRGLMLPVSRLNELRRQGLEALEAACAPPVREEREISFPQKPAGGRTACRTARFRCPGQITPEAIAFFDRISLPLHCFAEREEAASGSPCAAKEPPTGNRTARHAAVSREPRAASPAAQSRAGGEAASVCGAFVQDPPSAGSASTQNGNGGESCTGDGFANSLSAWRENGCCPVSGVVLPPVILDGELSSVRRMLARARAAGVRYATVGNLGHLALVREAGLTPVGDFRLNITNSESAALLFSLGFAELLLSPELTLPQLRDIGGNTAALVYGRIPLMTLEKCVIRELAGCEACRSDRVRMTDRKGISFPVLREWEHRNVVYNSLPTGMTDRGELLARYSLSNRHYLFSDEDWDDVNAVVRAAADSQPLPFPVRRIPLSKTKNEKEE